MVKAIAQPKNRLTPDDIKNIPVAERGKYIESYLAALVNANKERGLILSEIENVTGYPKNTLTKYLELLFSKRMIYKVKRGKMSIYYPNGRVSHPLNEQDILIDDRKYRVSIIDNPEGKQVYIQEKQIDENGFEDVIGGIMISHEHLDKIITKLQEVKDLNLRLLD